MSSGPLVGFCFDSTSYASNLVWLTDGCEIFVDCVGSGRLFVDSSSVLKMSLNSLSWMLLYIIPMCLVNFLIFMFLWALNNMAYFQVHVL